ncbi:hypothetical protein CVT25_003143 [Psilocybe cyanescens]|uniref:BTB domain-containing protein n=1 Tax=Psilocybe cyanescens TaxID=93625 RepID=A0A409XKB7_PSICY|nr:hypothetical protein CVT25_003143 [Psilocybe cyanescens]
MPNTEKAYRNVDPLSELAEDEILDFEKAHGLWFDDADVIFRAGSKAFRVHRSILSARSTVFNDMFSVPQASQAMNLPKDGKVTIVHLPDTEMDIYFFFSAIFDASYFEPPPSSPPLEVIVSILRLSHKYDVPFLKQRSAAHLEKLFPLDKERFSAVIQELSLASGSPEDVFRMVQCYLELALLSNVVDVQWILPTLFLMLSQYPLPVILSRDGWANLPASVQAEYLIFREGYMDALISAMGWLAALPAQNCVNKPTCHLHATLLSRKYYYTLGVRPSYTPSTVVMGGSFCTACITEAERCLKIAQNKRWSKYPQLLGFSGWDALRKMKTESGL